MENIPADSAEDDEAVTVNAALGEVLIDAYATPLGLPGVTVIPAGTMKFNSYHYVDNATGVTQFVYRVFKRTSGGIETELFNFTTREVNETSVTLITTQVTSTLPVPLDSTDRVITKIYAKTTSVANRIAHFVYEGTTHASYVETTLAIIANSGVSGFSGYNGSIGVSGYSGESGSSGFSAQNIPYEQIRQSVYYPVGSSWNPYDTFAEFDIVSGNDYLIEMSGSWLATSYPVPWDLSASGTSCQYVYCTDNQYGGTVTEGGGSVGFGPFTLRSINIHCVVSGKVVLKVSDSYTGYFGSYDGLIVCTGGVNAASGLSGLSGYSGFDAQAGYSGPSGYSGESGAEGISGYSGESGAAFVGSSGESGASGAIGESGLSGYSGFDAQAGYSGPSGYSGMSGFSSSAGGFNGFYKIGIESNEWTFSPSEVSGWSCAAYSGQPLKIRWQQQITGYSSYWDGIADWVGRDPAYTIAFPPNTHLTWTHSDVWSTGYNGVSGVQFPYTNDVGLIDVLPTEDGQVTLYYNMIPLGGESSGVAGTSKLSLMIDRANQNG
jgi:hypothetical protein